MRVLKWLWSRKTETIHDVWLQWLALFMSCLFLICTAVPATSVLQWLKKKANKTQPFMVVREGMWDSEFPQGCSLPCPCPSNMQCWDFPSHILHLLAGAFCITMPQVLHSRYQKRGWWESLLHFQTCCLSLVENLSWSGGQRVPRDFWAGLKNQLWDHDWSLNWPHLCFISALWNAEQPLFPVHRQKKHSSLSCDLEHKGPSK